MFRPGKIFNKPYVYYPFQIRKSDRISLFFHKSAAKMTDGILFRVERLRYTVYYENTMKRKNVYNTSR